MNQIAKALLGLQNFRVGFSDGRSQRFLIRVDDFAQFSGDGSCLLLIFRGRRHRSYILGEKSTFHVPLFVHSLMGIRRTAHKYQASSDDEILWGRTDTALNPCQSGGGDQSRVSESWLMVLSFMGCHRRYYRYAAVQPQDQGLVFRMGTARVRCAAGGAAPVSACGLAVLSRVVLSESSAEFIFSDENMRIAEYLPLSGTDSITAFI